MRELPEWIGATDDEHVPNRVRIRVFDAFKGICAGECGGKIRGAWEIDHIVALINGGENRESNLQPLCVECHAVKTSGDLAEKSKTYRIRAKHLGLLIKPRWRWR